MNPRKNTMLTMLLGLVLVASAAGVAQTTAQGDQKKKAEACCSMETCCCCNGNSCPMMKGEGATTADAKHSCSGDSCKLKTKGMQNHSDNHECCACCGESCEMKHDAAAMKHDANMKHDASMKHGAKGDCCKAKQKDAKAKARQ